MRRLLALAAWLLPAIALAQGYQGQGAVVKAIPSQPHKWVDSLSTSGIFHLSQPDLTDLTGHTFTADSNTVLTLNSSLAAGGGSSTAPFQLVVTTNLGSTDRALRLLNNTSTEVFSVGGDGTLRAAGNTTLNSGNGQLNAGTVNGSQVTLLGSQADGASAIAAKIRSSTTYANAAAKLLSIQNNTTEKASVDLNGNITANGHALSSISYNSFASRPSASISGSAFFCTNCPVATWVDDGSAWHPVVLGQVVGVQPDAAASWTGVNNTGTTLTDRNGALHYAGVNDTTNINMRGYCLSVSSSTAYIEAAIAPNALTNNGQGTPEMGILMRESSTSKMMSLLLVQFSSGSPAVAPWSYSLESYNWTNSTTRGTGTATDYFPTYTNAPLIMRIRIDASNVYTEFSTDRTNWTQIESRALTSPFTSGPNQVCVGAMNYNNAAGFDVLHLAHST